jgi:hypothetical protein
MTDLIKRLEEAEEGSADLDREVHFALGLVKRPRPGFSVNVPVVTTSIDAILALAERVLPGARWVMVQQPVGWGAMPLLFDGAAWNCPNDPGETVHALLPLALCIAILKATDTGRE